MYCTRITLLKRPSKHRGSELDRFLFEFKLAYFSKFESFNLKFSGSSGTKLLRSL